MMTTRQDAPVLDQESAHGGIRTGAAKSLARLLEREAHETFINRDLVLHNEPLGRAEALGKQIWEIQRV